jgi:WxcM-like, C-terminal
MKQCRLIDIPRFDEPRGTLSVIEGKPLLPFNPMRFFYIYGVPVSEKRACDALKDSEEFIIALAGRFTITVDDGYSKTDFELNRPDYGLYIPSLIWHELHNFAPSTVCGVLASKPYDRNDCYRVYEDFLDAIRGGHRS